MKHFCAVAVATFACILASLGQANAAQSGPLEIKDLGSFFILGRSVELSGQPIAEISTSPNMKPFKNDPNGDYETGQMYVNYVLLSKPKFGVPMLMWHGGGLTGQTWETKPDGKPGWNTFFMRAGFNVYVSDAVERGKSTWSKYPEIYTSNPIFRTKKEAWELFRLGPQYEGDGKSTPYADTQFPVESFRNFAAESTARWLTNDVPTQEAYDKEVQKVCPCVLVAHSQGASFALTAAQHAPDKIKAVVLVEASSAPDVTRVDFSKIRRIPYLFLWGDHINDSALWPGFQAKAKTYYADLKAENAPATWINLPELGIHGNTHMIMMDKNSDDVAKIVLDWLKKQNL
ncbi:Alpha/beta hydrolase family protein [Burkholderia sp. D7]|nr:Alpha/beta hydrolase family protein [Burkholderia sp. D7]